VILKRTLTPRRQSALEALPTAPNSLPEVPQGWSWACVEELASDEPRSVQSGPFGSSLLHSEFTPEGRLVIGIDNVHDGAFSMGSQNRIPARKFAELERFQARPLDVLITVMATVGRCCVVPADIEEAIITKHVYRISVEPRVIDPYFLMNALRGSGAVLEQMGANIRGQTRPGINGEILKALFVPLPPLEEQHEIVRLIDAAEAASARTQTESARSLALLDHLERSILTLAFRGELVPQDPADEPAAVTLVSAQASAAAAPRRGRPRRAA
jgi:type I restriction enzyme S subunit